jgi:malate/lactate dehydrogenase
VADEAEADAVVDAIVADRGTEFESIVRCEGERGIQSEFARVPVRIGARGVVEIIES